MNKKTYLYFLLPFIAVVAFWGWKSYLHHPVRLGYFFAGRTDMIYRAYINNYFDKEGINVKLYTKFLKGEKIFEIPKEKNSEEMSKPYFGKMTGTEIVDKIMKGEFDGGTIGASSFVASINKAAPIVAVALLGYDPSPGKAILMRSDVKINSPKDLKGKTLISRRAGPGDAIFLRMFLKSVGLNPEKDVTIIDQVDVDDAPRLLEEKKIDGGLFAMGLIKPLVESGTAYIYQPMNWFNTQLSHGILVFHKDYVKNHRDKVQKFVNAYVKRIAYEKNLPKEKRDKSWRKGLAMEGEFQGIRLQEYDILPRVRVDLLDDMQNLLYEYDEINTRVSISDFVDHGFLEKATKGYENF